MSETPISDSTAHNVGDLGMLCRRLERELNAANAIIRQQQLLDEENLRLKERIKQRDEWNKRLDELIDRQAEKIILLSEIRQEAGVQDANLRKKLSEANERIKRLEEAGDELANTQTYDLLETVNWHKAKEAKP
jgi:ribosome-binding protein aMBF1 (putative translation factor)